MNNLNLVKIAQGKLIKYAANLNLYDVYSGGMSTLPLVMESNPKLQAASELRKKILNFMGSKKDFQFTPLNLGQQQRRF